MGVLSMMGLEQHIVLLIGFWMFWVTDIKVICHVISFIAFVVDVSGLGCFVDVLVGVGIE
jgi:hypothetical protein